MAKPLLVMAGLDLIAVRFNSAANFNIVIPEGRPSRPIRDLAPDET